MNVTCRPPPGDHKPPACRAAVLRDNQEDHEEMGVLNPVPMRPSGKKHYVLIDSHNTCHGSNGCQPMLLWLMKLVCRHLLSRSEKKSVVSPTDDESLDKQIFTDHATLRQGELCVFTRHIRIGSVIISRPTIANLGSYTKIPTAQGELEKGKLTRLIIGTDIVKTFFSFCEQRVSLRVPVTPASLTRTIHSKIFQPHMHGMCCMSIV